MADIQLIAANDLLRFIEGEIEKSKDELQDARNNGNAENVAYNGGEIQEARRIKLHIMKTPPSDAVPVVRCKDCKHRGTPYNCPMRTLVMPWQGAGSYEDCTEDDGYCHMGVKKDGGAEDEH